MRNMSKMRNEEIENDQSTTGEPSKDDQASSEDAGGGSSVEGVITEEFSSGYDDTREGKEDIIYNDSEEIEPAPGPSHPVEDFTLEGVMRKKEHRIKQEIKGQDQVKQTHRGPQVAFLSCQNRPLLPSVFPPNRMRDFYYKSRTNLAPTSYDISAITSSLYQLDKVASTNVKGWGFGVLKEPRFCHQHKDLFPDPFRYQPNISQLKKFKPAFRPFGSSSERFRRTRNNIPGPGTYDQDAIIGRRIQFQQSFGYTPPDLQKKRKRKSKSGKSKAHINRVKYLELHE